MGLGCGLGGGIVKDPRGRQTWELLFCAVLYIGWHLRKVVRGREKLWASSCLVYFYSKQVRKHYLRRLSSVYVRDYILWKFNYQFDFDL